jgi:atypical dual specificity phosphatase
LGTGGKLLRRLRARVSDVPTGFVWVDDHRLAASGFPSSRGQLQWLAGQGITAILTLTPDPLPKEMASGLPLELMHLPMQDHGVPTSDTLAEGARLIQDKLAEGKTVLVHCLAGQGRTGSILAAYLVKERRMTATQAVRTLRTVKPSFVERPQERAIANYELELAKS